MKKKIELRSLVITAVLTALSIVITRLLSLQVTPEMRIGFGPLPLILVGLLFGPVLGALSGIAADLVGMMISAMGSFHPGFTLSSALTGFIPGLVAYFLLRGKGPKRETLAIGISIVLVYGLVHLILNSLWISQLYGSPLGVLISGRALKVVVEGVLTFILVKMVYGRIYEKALNRNGHRVS